MKFKTENLTYLKQGEVAAKSPSNIALVKYWGKLKNQIPTNASISYTLTNSFTETILKFKEKEGEELDVKVFLDGEETPSFVPKILMFFERIEEFIPFLRKYSFELHTKNSFPHSSGIASSASGMSALALCLMKMEAEFGLKLSQEEFLQKASYLARLGSGSASRSVYNGLVVWGEHPKIEGSSDEFSVPYPLKVAEVFKSFNDVILLVHEGQKSMSSTAGHNLMNNHPYAEERFKQANQNLEKLILILENGDLESFGKLIEHEALSLHAMMLTSDPAYILMQPNTLAVLQKVWAFRKQTTVNLFFTLDAGANVHLLFPEQDKALIKEYIKNDLAKYCHNGNYIEDKVSW